MRKLNLLFIAVTIVVMGNALAQIRPRPVPVPLPPIGPVETEGRISNPDQFSVIVQSGARESFTPFLLTEHPVVQNGRLVSRGINAETVIQVPLDNGSVNVKASEYYNLLNNFEQFLTNNGYTLRKQYNDVTIKKLVIRPEEVAGFNVQRENTQRTLIQDQTVIANHRQLVNDQVLVIKDPNRQRGAIADNDLQIRNINIYRPIIIRPDLPEPKPKAYSKSDFWNGKWGWDNKFSAFLDSSLKLDGIDTFTQAKANGNAGAHIFGKKLELIKGEAFSNTPKTGNLQGHLYAYALGFKFINVDYNNPAAYFYSNEFSKNFDESTTIHFTLGPIPMAAKIGGQGSASVFFRFAFLPLKANADIKPAVAALAYVQVGADIVVAGAGGGANLTLIKDDLDVVGRLQLTTKDLKPVFYVNTSAYNELEAIKGNMYVYVYIYVPAWDIPPWKKKQWNWNIFEFGGIKTTGNLYSFSAYIPLF